MFLYFCSARSSLLLAGSGSSEGSSAGEEAAAAIGLLADSAPGVPGGNGFAGIVSPVSTAGCPGGSDCPLLLLLTDFASLAADEACGAEALPLGEAAFPMIKPRTTPATMPMSP